MKETNKGPERDNGEVPILKQHGGFYDWQCVKGPD